MTKRRKLLLAFAILSTIVVVALVAPYELMVRSEAYSQATEFVSSIPIVEGSVGEIVGVDLAPLEGFRLRRRGEGGYARFCLDVHGTERDAKVFVFMRRVARSWSIESAALAVAGEEPTIELVLPPPTSSEKPKH